jgi:hypothetical protein
MSDRVYPSSAPDSRHDTSSADEVARAKVNALVGALGRLAARQLWAGAMANDGEEAAPETATPTRPARQHGKCRHAGG